MVTGSPLAGAHGSGAERHLEFFVRAVDFEGDRRAVGAAGPGPQKVHARRAEKSGDEPVGGPVVELERRADLVDSSLVHHHDPVGHRHGFRLVVGDVDHGRLKFGVEPPQFDPHLRPQGGIEVGKRLVET